MSGSGTRRSAWLVIPVIAIMLAWTGALPAVARPVNPSPNPEPCPGISLQLQLGNTTPVLLVHGFNEGPGVFAQAGSPTLKQAISSALGSSVTLVPFDYSNWNKLWVTFTLIGPQLAKCITWLTHTSDTQGGPGKVIIVAHSMGGLVVRCAVNPDCAQGTQAADPSLIGLVITLGTPNIGSFPQTLGSVLDTICTLFPQCNDLVILRDSPAAEAMAPGSNDLAELPLLPTSIPVDAIAGQITVTTELFGRTYVLEDFGDVIVPVTSALADAQQGALHAGPGAGKTTISCGSIPVNLPSWSQASRFLKAPASPVTCWHVTETTDAIWQHDIIAAIKPAAQALSMRACTSAAISTAIAAKDPTNAAQRTLVTFACNSGWALAEVHQPLTLSDGSVVQDTGFAILKQGNSVWSSNGLDDGTCLVSPGICSGVLLPPPAILHLLLQKAGISLASTQAELYINTVFTPGQLYKYPSGPPKIGIDNHNYIDGLQWTAGSQGDLIGTGTLHYDDCNPDCAGGTYHTSQVQITASNPQQCAVQVYPNGLGNPSQSVQADVFSTIDVQAVQGNPPSFLVGNSVLSKPCG